MKPLVLFHGAHCRDGFGAAYLFYKAMPDAEFVSVTHGYPPPMADGRKVYVLDFCYPPEHMTLLADSAAQVIVLDHHKTSAEAMIGWSHPKATVHFDMVKSGVMLAWEYLAKNDLLDLSLFPWCTLAVPPWFVQYIQDRDLWSWALIDSEQINEFIRSLPLEFAAWDKMMIGKFATGQSFLLELAARGATIVQTKKTMVAEHVQHARPILLCGVVGLAVNATLLQSEIAGELSKTSLFGACYTTTGYGSQLWSLRSQPKVGIDVSEIAKQFGGGGHKHASGFQVPAEKLWRLRIEAGALTIGELEAYERIQATLYPKLEREK